jgi:hypothetical protein
MELIVTTRAVASLTAGVHAKIVARFRSLPQPLHLHSSERMPPAAVHQLFSLTKSPFPSQPWAKRHELSTPTVPTYLIFDFFYINYLFY